MNGFFKYFAGGGFPITAIILVMAVVLVFIIMMIYVPTLVRKIFPKFGYSKYYQYLPFKTVYTDNSMTLTDGGIIRVYRVNGVQTSMQDDATREKFLDLRAQLFNQIRDPNVVLRFYMVRDAVGENTNYEFDQPVLQKIYNKWKAQGLRIFNNNYYIVISVRGNDARAKLNQYCNYIETILAAYKPTVLRNDSPDNMAKFFGRILSPITKPAPIVCNQNIAEMATVDDVEFLDNGIIRYIGAGRQSFAAMLSFKMSPDYLDEDFYNSVFTIQTEMICMNGFNILGTADVENVIRQRRATAEENEKSAEEHGGDVSEATFDAESNVPSEEVVAAADQLKKGENTDVIETDAGCYVAKVTSLLDKDATKDKKEEIVEERKAQRYQDTCEGWREEADIKEHDSVWKKIDFNELSVTIKQSSEEPYADALQTDDQAEAQESAQETE